MENNKTYAVYLGEYEHRIDSSEKLLLPMDFELFYENEMNRESTLIKRFNSLDEARKCFEEECKDAGAGIIEGGGNFKYATYDVVTIEEEIFNEANQNYEYNDTIDCYIGKCIPDTFEIVEWLVEELKDFKEEDILTNVNYKIEEYLPHLDADERDDVISEFLYYLEENTVNHVHVEDHEVVMDFESDCISELFDYNEILEYVLKRISNGVKFEDLKDEIYNTFVVCVQRSLNELISDYNLAYLLRDKITFNAHDIITRLSFEDLLENLSYDIKRKIN